MFLFINVFPCSDRKVSCNKESCIEEHIVCLCSQSNKVPLEDRAYLRDQRMHINFLPLIDFLSKGFKDLIKNEKKYLIS